MYNRSCHLVDSILTQTDVSTVNTLDGSTLRRNLILPPLITHRGKRLHSVLEPIWKREFL